MKLGLYFFGFFLLFSCAHQVVPAPDKLLSMEEMEAIVYDISILQAAVQTDRTYFKEQSITPLSYVFKKYAIDSLVYVQNDLYYASRPQEYEVIYRRVEKRLQALKLSYDKASLEETSIK